MKTIIIYLILTPLLLSGCAGLVGGDLANVQPSERTYVRGGNFKYLISCSSNGQDDGGNKNISGYISTFSLGIIPTYWMTPVNSTAKIFKNGALLEKYEYESIVHKFYGIIWGFIVPLNSVNSLRADEGGGIRVEWGIRDRTFWKAIEDHGGNPQDYRKM